MAESKVQIIDDMLAFIDDKNRTVEFWFAIVDRMVAFIDMVISRVSPERSEKLNKRVRKDLILKFLKAAGFIGLRKRSELRKRKRSGDVWRITQECSEAITRGRLSEKRDYLSAVFECVPDNHLGIRSDYFEYFECLDSLFWYENKSFFTWLADEIDIVHAGLKRKKGKIDAIRFALAVVTEMDAERCSSRWISRAVRRAERRKERRRAKRQAERQRRLAEQNINKSSTVENLGTELATNSSESSPEGQNTVNAASEVVASLDAQTTTSP
jgi:hypothetical protein